MPEKKVLRLTCPVCETHLKVSEGIERFACLNCGAELKVEQDGDLVKVAPTQDSAARMSDSQQQLIEVNSALKAADDVYGVGCAIATMGITLAACVILALAIVVQSQPLFWGAIAVALVLLGFVLFMFLTASSRGTDPLLRKRDRLQAQVEAEQEASTTGSEVEETASGPFDPGEEGEEVASQAENTIEPARPLARAEGPVAGSPPEAPGQLEPPVDPASPFKPGRTEPMG